MAVSDIQDIEIQVEALVQVNKRPAWEFAIDIDGAPGELDILARDLSYEPITINVEERNFGSQQVTMPSGTERTTLVITLRDTRDKKLYQWCNKVASEVAHSDGTFGLPENYVKEVTIYSTTSKDDDPSPDTYKMIFTNVGAINPDRSAKDQYLEFPITMTEYKTGGFK